jgi:hypothetical protein
MSYSAIHDNKNLSEHIWLGKVVDNNDPRRLGRLKIQIPQLTDNIQIDALPWYRPKINADGKSFGIVDTGKLVSVSFHTNNIYDGEYWYAEHYDINLIQKLESLSSDAYKRFAALYYDGDFQIYADPSVGAVIDYMKSNIKINPNGHIMLNLMDNSKVLFLGSDTASQRAVLGDHFFDWMDKLINAMESTSYLGNSGAPVAPTPQLLSVLAEYRALRASTFLSENVMVVDNREVQGQNRSRTIQRGDAWTSNEKPDTRVPVEIKPPIETKASEPEPVAEGNEMTVKSSDQLIIDETIVKDEYERVNGDGIVIRQNDNGEDIIVDVNSEDVGTPNQGEFDPTRYLLKPSFTPTPLSEGENIIGFPQVSPQPENFIPTPAMSNMFAKYEPVSINVGIGGYALIKKYGYEPGKHPRSMLKPLKTVACNSGVDPFLLPEAADAFNELFYEYSKTQFEGKQPLIITSVYRNQKVSGFGVGTHGGIAVDLNYGNSGEGANLRTPPPLGSRVSAEFRHPVRQWLFKNALKFGISQPRWVYGGNQNSPCECWHWEYVGNNTNYTIHDGGQTPDSFNFEKNPFNFERDAALMVSYHKNYKGTGTLVKL